MTRPTVAAYAILGSLLVWSRLAQLDRWGYCCDEISTLLGPVRAGPRAILTGPYTPNNHELYSLLGWATTSVFGESEVALRLGAAIPFILGVTVVTAWLHVRVGAISALFFLGFATVSPLLLDITRLARGYGLAFLAASVMFVAALEAVRGGWTWAVAAFWVSGLVGTWTLPHFAIAFFATGAVLLLRPELRRTCLVAGGLSVLAVALWYAPHFDDIEVSSAQDYGARIHTAWLLTAPFDQVLTPALLNLDETVVDPSLDALAVAAILAILVGSSPLLRERDSAPILVTGVVATLVAFWATGTEVVPRFFSFLLVPVFILLATGCGHVVRRLTSRPAGFGTPSLVVLGGILVVATIPLSASAVRSRRDSLREAAAVVHEQARDAPVYAYMPYPADLAFHLRREVVPVTQPADTARVCDEPEQAVLVTQPWFWQPAPEPLCVARRGARHYRFHQYARGKETDVWVVPPRES